MSRPVYCRNCYGLVAAGADYCPSCGIVIPGQRPKVYTALFAGLIAASVVTGVWAWLVSQLWDKWVKRFERLPEDHPLFQSETLTAWGIGAGLFLATWVFALLVMRTSRQP